MCMIDDGGEQVTMLSQADPVARKTHNCRECRRDIAPGERYHVDRFILEGNLETHKMCAHCMVPRQWLLGECGGWPFGEMAEEIREHAKNGGYPMGLHRLAVGMAWKWRTPTGKLLPIPKMPPTTRKRMHAV